MHPLNFVNLTARHGTTATTLALAGDIHWHWLHCPLRGMTWRAGTASDDLMPCRCLCKFCSQASKADTPRWPLAVLVDTIAVVDLRHKEVEAGTDAGTCSSSSSSDASRSFSGEFGWLFGSAGVPLCENTAGLGSDIYACRWCSLCVCHCTPCILVQSCSLPVCAKTTTNS